MSKLDRLMNTATRVSSVGLFIIGIIFAFYGHYDRAAFDVAVAIYGQLVAEAA